MIKVYLFLIKNSDDKNYEYVELCGEEHLESHEAFLGEEIVSKLENAKLYPYAFTIDKKAYKRFKKERNMKMFKLLTFTLPDQNDFYMYQKFFREMELMSQHLYTAAYKYSIFGNLGDKSGVVKVPFTMTRYEDEYIQGYFEAYDCEISDLVPTVNLMYYASKCMKPKYKKILYNSTMLEFISYVRDYANNKFEMDVSLDELAIFYNHFGHTLK